MGAAFDYLGPCCWPRTLPALPALLDQLGNPGAARLGRLLGVNERTARRWLAAGRAPRVAVLALYLCTPGAASEREQRSHEAARLHAALYECARRDLRAALQLVDRLAPLARAGAANEPIRPALRSGL